MKINEFLCHSQFEVNALKADVEKVCSEARAFKFNNVTTSSVWAEKLVKELKASDVQSNCLVSYFHGSDSLKTKVAAVLQNAGSGIDEISYFIDHRYLKKNDFVALKNEYETLNKAAQTKKLNICVNAQYSSTNDLEQFVNKFERKHVILYFNEVVSLANTIENLKLKEQHDVGVICEEIDLKTTKKIIKLGVKKIYTASCSKLMKESNE